MLQEEHALISSSFWKEIAAFCFCTVLLPTPSKPHPWEARKTSRRWRTHSSCSAIVAGTNKAHHSSNEHHPAMWLPETSTFLLDLMNHEGFWRIAQGWQLPDLTNHSVCFYPWDVALSEFCCDWYFALPHSQNLQFHTTTQHLWSADICLCPLIAAWDLLPAETLMISNTTTRCK